MNRTYISLFFACLVASLAGCSSSHPTTQTTVIIEADNSLRAQIQNTRIRVLGADGTTWLDQQSAAALSTWPIRNALTPKRDATERFTVDAEGYNAQGAVIARTRATSGFLLGKQAEITLWFLSDCPASCPNGFICGRDPAGVTGCLPENRDPMEIRPDAGADAQSNVDAGDSSRCLNLEICGNLIDDDCNGLIDDCTINPLDGGIDGSRDGSSDSSTCATEDICGNLIDDDCNGLIDDACGACTDGQTRSCSMAAGGQRNVGVCVDGLSRCVNSQWSACEGAVGPSNEICDGVDNDCDGQRDEIAGCNTGLLCPATTTVQPFSTVTLSGSNIYTGNDVSRWEWSIDCPLDVDPSLCPQVPAANIANPEIYVTQSGTYRVRVRIVKSNNEVLSCGWSMQVRGGGLRVELSWPEMGMSGSHDLDLHLHRWTSNQSETAFLDANDCYYGNCKAGDSIEWAGHPDSALSNCENAPRGEGADWRAIGSCRNPRLDIDNISCDRSITDPNNSDFCAPENINVDTPIAGQPYRIAVTAFSGTGTPHVNVYCGGALAASIEALVLSSTESTGRRSWYVGDVVFPAGSSTSPCTVFPINETTSSSMSSTFGPAWQCPVNPATGVCL